MRADFDAAMEAVDRDAWVWRANPHVVRDLWGIPVPDGVKTVLLHDSGKIEFVHQDGAITEMP